MSLATPISRPPAFSRPPALPMRRFTVEEFHKMIEAGIFHEDDHIELLDGWIVEKMVHNPKHDAVLQRTNKALIRRLPDRLTCARAKCDCAEEISGQRARARFGDSAWAIRSTPPDARGHPTVSRGIRFVSVFRSQHQSEHLRARWRPPLLDREYLGADGRGLHLAGDRRTRWLSHAAGLLDQRLGSSEVGTIF